MTIAVVASEDTEILIETSKLLEKDNIQVIMVRSPHTALSLLGLIPKAEQTYSCPICNEICDSKEDILVHQCKRICVKIYKCPDCGIPFKMAHLLEAHQLTSHGIGETTCPFCNRGFESVRAVNAHKPSHRVQHSKLSGAAKFDLIKKKYVDLEDKVMNFVIISKEEDANLLIGDSKFVEVLNKKEIQNFILKSEMLDLNILKEVLK